MKYIFSQSLHKPSGLNFWMGFRDSLAPHLAFVQCEQVKFRPKKKAKKCSGGRRDNECVQWGVGGKGEGVAERRPSCFEFKFLQFL